MATPLEIEIALHYHCSGSYDYGLGGGNRNHHAPAVQEALKRFVDMGLLNYRPDGDPKYSATEGLKFYTDRLCWVQFPVRKWVMP